MQIDTAALAVITSAIVAVAAVIIPLVAPIIGENIKWARKQRSATSASVIEKTITLQASLSNFWARNYERAAGPVNPAGYPAAQAANLANFYAWETIITPLCDKAHRDRLLALRAKIESSEFFGGTPEQAPERQRSTSAEVHELTQFVLGRIK